jgi:N-ethylmaleimide reductase
VTTEDKETRLLLQPFLFGDLTLPNRIFMAPLTRMRAPLEGAVPNALMREYYAQQ